MQNAGYDPTIATTKPDSPAGIGNLAAAAVLTYRHDDGANQLGDRHPSAYSGYTGYRPTNSYTKVVDLNHWQPLATPNGSVQGGCVDDGIWKPSQPTSFVTPAFPEFISGHSTFSAASAEAPRSFTGSDVFSHSVTVNFSRVEPGLVPAQPVPLQWATFTEAANEAGLSRRYGGIHFAQGDLVGRALGRQVGARTWEKAQHFFVGTAAPVADLSSQTTAIIAQNNFDFIFRPYRFYLPTIARSEIT